MLYIIALYLYQDSKRTAISFRYQLHIRVTDDSREARDAERLYCSFSLTGFNVQLRARTRLLSLMATSASAAAAAAEIREKIDVKTLVFLLA